MANYYRHQARSLSHYERFRPYHESFYRFVEPGSVTPCTFQVRRRALHAALVIAVRHSLGGLNGNKAAGCFDREAADVGRRRVRAQGAYPSLRARRRRTRPGHTLDQLLDEWDVEAKRCRGDNRALHYEARDKAYSPLLYGHGDGFGGRGLWATLHSMRNVEQPAVLKMGEAVQ